MTRATLFLRTNLPEAAWVLHRARIRNELAALQPSQAFHIWWHDHNLGVDTQRRMARVAQILDMVAERCARGQLVSANMSDLLPIQHQAAAPPVEAQRVRQ